MPIPDVASKRANKAATRSRSVNLPVKVLDSGNIPDQGETAEQIEKVIESEIPKIDLRVADSS